MEKNDLNATFEETAALTVTTLKILILVCQLKSSSEMTNKNSTELQRAELDATF
jgi:hypothetical protein